MALLLQDDVISRPEGLFDTQLAQDARATRARRAKPPRHGRQKCQVSARVGFYRHGTPLAGTPFYSLKSAHALAGAAMFHHADSILPCSGHTEFTYSMPRALRRLFRGKIKAPATLRFSPMPPSIALPRCSCFYLHTRVNTPPAAC